jgi:hypothetical protein
VLAAFDAGINFFFLSVDMHWPLYEGTRRGLEALLARGGCVRDEIVVGVVSYLEQPLFQAFQVHEVIDAVAGLERVDLIIAGGVSNPASLYSRLEPMTYARNANFRGARAIGASFHDRRLAATAATYELLDILYVRYNTAHPGARIDLFPSLPAVRTGRIFNFKSTMFKVTAEMLRGLRLSPPNGWLPTSRTTTGLRSPVPSSTASWHRRKPRRRSRPSRPRSPKALCCLKRKTGEARSVASPFGSSSTSWLSALRSAATRASAHAPHGDRILAN